MAHKVGAKGQVVIDSEIRKKLGVEPGWTTIQVLVDDHVELRFLPPPHRDSLMGCLGAATMRIPEKDWRRSTEEAWQQAVHEKWTEE